MIVTSSKTDTASLALRIHRLLLRLQQRNKFVGIVDHTGLSPLETHLIIEIQAEQGLPISSYASRLMVDISICTRIIQKFSRGGYVTITPGATDQRRKELSLTAAGVALIKQIDEFADHVIDSLREPLSSRSWQDLVRFFQMMADAGGVPKAPKRPGEEQYRVQQRRITRLFGLLGNSAWGTPHSSTEIQVLTEILYAPVPPRIAELAELLGLQPHSTGEVVSKFEALGLVERRSFDGDGRVSIIVATAKGRRIFSGLETHMSGVLTNALRNFSQGEIARFIEILTVFTGTVDLCWPMLPRSLRVTKVDTNELRQIARGFVARTYVDYKIEAQIPEAIIPSDHALFAVYRDTLLVGTICVKIRAGEFIAPHICAGANLPPWSLAGAWGEVVRTSAQKPGPVLKRALADVTAAPLSLEKVLRGLAGG
jgi:DNA-binding MarR family transcriptional regulator